MKNYSKKIDIILSLDTPGFTFIPKKTFVPSFVKTVDFSYDIAFCDSSFYYVAGFVSSFVIVDPSP